MFVSRVTALLFVSPTGIALERVIVSSKFDKAFFAPAVELHEPSGRGIHGALSAGDQHLRQRQHRSVLALGSSRNTGREQNPEISHYLRAL